LSAIDKYVKALKQASFCGVLPAQNLPKAAAIVTWQNCWLYIKSLLFSLKDSKYIHQADIDNARVSFIISYFILCSFNFLFVSIIHYL
jgi:hypothetical protein